MHRATECFDDEDIGLCDRGSGLRSFSTQIAFATTVTVTYQGTVTLVQDPDGVFGGAYQEGDPITGSMILSRIPAKPVFDHQEPGSSNQF